jgi:hypothetical protein
VKSFHFTPFSKKNSSKQLLKPMKKPTKRPKPPLGAISGGVNPCNSKKLNLPPGGQHRRHNPLKTWTAASPISPSLVPSAAAGSRSPQLPTYPHTRLTHAHAAAPSVLKPQADPDETYQEPPAGLDRVRSTQPNTKPSSCSNGLPSSSCGQGMDGRARPPALGSSN